MTLQRLKSFVRYPPKADGFIDIRDRQDNTILFRYSPSWRQIEIQNRKTKEKHLFQLD